MRHWEMNGSQYNEIEYNQFTQYVKGLSYWLKVLDHIVKWTNEPINETNQ